MADDPLAGLTADDRDAYTFLRNQFARYGLESLAPIILEYLQQGFSSDTIAIQLQETDAYKQRFSANAARIKKGLPALSPAEYISTEKSYRQIMSHAGLPVGFYDQASDFQAFLENDISPTEVQSRVEAATEAIHRAPPETLSFAQQWYSTGDLVAYALDPSRAEPIVERRLRAAEAAAVAQERGMDLAQESAEIVARNVTSYEQIGQAVGAIGAQAKSTDYLADVYGGTVTQQEIVKAVVENDVEATEKIRKLASQERASFGKKSAYDNGQALSRRGGGNL